MANNRVPTAHSTPSGVVIWDLPLRLFHWLLVLAVAGAISTGIIGGNAMLWHGRCGLAVIGLIAFRLGWGVLGSPTARFSHFVRGPRAILAYLRGEWRGVGHNPLGALSVLAMLALFGGQAVGGLFANDDIAFQGPLRSLVDKATSDAITGWHHRMYWPMLGLIGLHVGAIVFYRSVKKQDLVTPMLTGRGASEQPAPLAGDTGSRSAGAGHWVRLIVCLVLAVLAVWAAAGGWLPPPPPPPVTPDW